MRSQSKMMPPKNYFYRRLSIKNLFFLSDITDDLVPIDEPSLQRRRIKINRYQTMSIEERREYNQKRRLRQLGLPDNLNDVAPEKLKQIKRHISEVNARKAEAARIRYHRMVWQLQNASIPCVNGRWGT